MRRVLLQLLTVSALLTFAGSAQALVAYPDAAGTSFNFLNMQENTTSAGDPEPLFDAPTVVGDNLLFTPSGFISQAAGGATDQTNATFEFDIESIDPFATAIEQILVTEVGDYFLTGSGTASTTASAGTGAGLIIRELNIDGVLTAGIWLLPGLVTDFVQFDTPAASGGWSLSLDVDVQGFVDTLGLTNAYATKASVTWNNDLATTSETNSTSLIQKKIGVPAVTMEVIPEPTTGLLVGIGLVAMAQARRRQG